MRAIPLSLSVSVSCFSIFLWLKLAQTCNVNTSSEYTSVENWTKQKPNEDNDYEAQEEDKNRHLWWVFSFMHLPGVGVCIVCECVFVVGWSLCIIPNWCLYVWALTLIINNRNCRFVVLRRSCFFKTSLTYPRRIRGTGHLRSSMTNSMRQRHRRRYRGVYLNASPCAYMRVLSLYTHQRQYLPIEWAASASRFTIYFFCLNHGHMLCGV